MLRPSLFVLVLTLIFLTACSPTVEEPQPLMVNVSPTATIEVPVSTDSPPTLTVLPTSPPTIEPKVAVDPSRDMSKPGEGDISHLCSPLDGHSFQDLFEIVTDPYNPPPMGRDERHQGVDFSYYQRGDRESIEGVVIQSILPGVVVGSFDNQIPYGNMIMIETHVDDLPEVIVELFSLEEDQSLYHVYAHMLEPPDLLIGEPVECGQPLGLVGSTGYNIINAHLHLEVRTGPSGSVFEEISFYNTQANAAEMENYRLWRMSGVFQHHDPMKLFEPDVIDPQN